MNFHDEVAKVKDQAGALVEEAGDAAKKKDELLDEIAQLEQAKKEVEEELGALEKEMEDAQQEAEQLESEVQDTQQEAREVEEASASWALRKSGKRQRATSAMSTFPTCVGAT
jgi:chromosome segregation ATPase